MGQREQRRAGRDWYRPVCIGEDSPRWVAPWPAWTGGGFGVQVRWSEKRKRWLARDPDWPRLQGIGKTEEAAVEDLEDQVLDASYEAELMADEMEWPADD